jgi:diguanylate cyclase (GGDEF)-like protein
VLGTKGAFFIAALLCFVMLLAVFSVKDSRVPGVRTLLVANLLGLGANLLYGYGRDLHPFVAYEFANTLYIAASMAALITFRRFFSRPPKTTLLVCALLVFLALISAFHYGVNSFTARLVIVSAFQACIAFAIACTIVSARDTWSTTKYPFVFCLGTAAVIFCGHLYRIAQQFLRPDAPQSLHDATEWNVLLIAVGAFSFPVLTLGGLLIVHRKMMALAEYAANHDYLTGAWSRRAFFDIGERELARSERKNRNLSVMVLDLDNMKAINDTFGHASGDEALTHFVSNVTARLRVSDYLARVGGDEFMVLMPETDLPTAVSIANRLLNQIGEAQSKLSPSGSSAPKVAFSVGVACRLPKEGFHSLLKRADGALYKAKTEGRNQVVASEQEALPI